MRAAKERKREEMGGGVREERVVRITIEDSMRPREVIVARQVEDDVGRFGRFRVDGFCGRPVGWSGLGALVGRLVR